MQRDPKVADSLAFTCARQQLAARLSAYPAEELATRARQFEGESQLEVRCSRGLPESCGGGSVKARALIDGTLSPNFTAVSLNDALYRRKAARFGPWKLTV